MEAAKISAKFNTPSKDMVPFSSVSKVRVIVRVRPFLPQERSAPAKGEEPKSCISVLDQDCDASRQEEVAVFLKDPDTSRNECYKLDAFFGQEDGNVRKIFDKEVKCLIPEMLCGVNATVFAYGATGSGKTYTMQGTENMPGLMPQAMSTILSMSQKTGTLVEISYFEVYLERCIDLLQTEPREIRILDDKEGQMHLKGLYRVAVSSMAEFNEVFSRGVQRRKVAHTGLNDISSRSHGVLVIAVSTPCGDGSGAFVTGKLNLIDLAGNEDNRRSGNEGILLQESSKINQSLFALSNVIYALNNNKPRVPYRESKLTRILQDSLGGTSHALMVACLNPREYQESVRTVSLASRSRHISNFVSSAHKLDTPKVKVDMEAKLQAWLESKGKTKSSLRMGALQSPFLSKTPISLAKKKPNFQSSAKVKTGANQNKSIAVERNVCVHFENLFNQERCKSLSENLTLALEDSIKEHGDNTNSIDSEPTTCASDGSKENDATLTECVVSSPTSEKKFGASPRVVLSPINNNINVQLNGDDCCKSTDHSCRVLLEPETPGMTEKFQMDGTPFNKFSARSINLKQSLMQEYIDFLNTASREELQEIKGIGLKMAEYIVELRESSPLTSLHDLQKLGLSFKQVYNLFNKAARGLFDNLDL